RRILAFAFLSTACGVTTSDVDDSDNALVEPSDMTTWKWQTRLQDSDCRLSDVGQAVHDAVMNSGHNLDIFPEEGRDQIITAKRHAAGPSFVDGKQIWPALTELIALAKYEVDAQWHRIDHDSDAFDSFVLGLKKLHERLQRERPTRPVMVRLVNSKWA